MCHSVSALEIGVVPGNKSIENSIPLLGDAPGSSFGKISKYSDTTLTENESSSLDSDWASTTLAKNPWHLCLKYLVAFA